MVGQKNTYVGAYFLSLAFSGLDVSSDDDELEEDRFLVRVLLFRSVSLDRFRLDSLDRLLQLLWLPAFAPELVLMLTGSFLFVALLALSLLPGRFLLKSILFHSSKSHSNAHSSFVLEPFLTIN